MENNEVRVLIVGGQAEERESCKTILIGSGDFEYTICEAASGEEGLKLRQTNHPDCIVLICGLPDVEPVDFLGGMADSSGRVSVSVVALVDKGKKVSARKLLNGGALDVLMKDQLTPLVLSRMVRYAIESGWAEKRIEELRTLFKTILTAMPGFLVLKNRDLVYQAMNPTFCQFLGKGPAEIMGKRDADLFPSDEAEAYHQADAEVLRSGVMQTREEQVTGPDGKRWLQVNRSPIIDSEGVTAGILWSARDITQAKEKQALKDSMFLGKAPTVPDVAPSAEAVPATKKAPASEAEQEAAAEAPQEEKPAAEMLCEFLPSYQITVVNDAFCEFVGKTAEELIGKSLHMIVPADDKEKINEHLATLTNTRPTGTYQHSLISATGEARQFEWDYTAEFGKNWRLQIYKASIHEAVVGTKECPECAETVRAKAKKCRFCGYTFAE